MWNGEDAIMKERIFGLGGHEGNHGEDAKEYWWYLDSTPTHSWMRWRYHYPQSRFPYGDLVRANAARTRADPEFELVDTGIFDEASSGRSPSTTPRPAPTDICVKISIQNNGPETATLHMLPTLWFRNTWAWGLPGWDDVPTIHGYDHGTLVATHRDPRPPGARGRGRTRGTRV